MASESNSRKDPFLMQCALVSGAFLVCAYLCSLAAQEYWVFDLLRHFMTQYLVGSLILAPFFLWKKKYILGGLVVLTGCASFIEIVWRFHVAPIPSMLDDATIVKIAHYNKNIGNTDQSSLIAWIKSENPDIFVIQEAGDTISHALYSLKDTYPYQVLEPRKHAFGQVLASKFPIVDSAVVRTKAYSFENFYIHALIQIPDGPEISYYTIHPPPPVNAQYSKQRNGDLDAIGDAVATDKSKNIIVSGDWNITAYSPYFSNLMQKTGLQNIYISPTPIPTWPSQYVFQIFQIPIDYVLFKGDMILLERRRADAMGSDHYPVVASFALKN